MDNACGHLRVIEEIRSILLNNSDFTIAGHVNPDEDTVGACYGLAMALSCAGKKAAVFLEKHSDRMDAIPGAWLRFHGKAGELGKGVLICLDCADAARLGEAKCLLDTAECTVCVDHHMTNGGFAEHNYIDPGASSTSELIFGLIDGVFPVNSEIAAALYTGILTDTGGFRFDTTSKKTMECAGRLMDFGIPFTEIYTRSMFAHTRIESKLLGKIIGVAGEKMDGRLVYSYVSREMLKELRATGRDVDGVTEYLLNTRGAEIAALFFEKSKNNIKVSMRSREVNVGKIAAEFGGGGHRLASGCSVEGGLHTVCGRVLELLENKLTNE
ncbi:MAG: bifunctional oligoribonuclease/PAP phosphatase NrnA [Defluviitaleaceae bacterium]|nr:bifunctional oligoribonuclease/PAP phosphatase NrnA [Defluviitaleaceae bacterium]